MCLAGDSGRVPSYLGLQLAALAALRWIVKGMVLCSSWELLRRGSRRVIFAIAVWLQRLVPLLQSQSLPHGCYSYPVPLAQPLPGRFKFAPKHSGCSGGDPPSPGGGACQSCRHWKSLVKDLSGRMETRWDVKDLAMVPGDGIHGW